MNFIPFHRLPLVGMLFALTLLAFSCETTEIQPESLPQPVSFLPTSSQINELVERANEQNGHVVTDPLASFTAEGAIEIFLGYDKIQKIDFLRIGINVQGKADPKRTALFEVQLDEAIDLPRLISSGKIIYLQNQLTLIDQDKMTAIHFFVDDGIHANAVPSASLVSSQSLMLQKGPAALGKRIGDDESCTCSCKRCWNENDCGSASSSCSCGNNSQSQACRMGYNAECSGCS